MTRVDAIKAAFQATVTAAIGGDKDHGWGYRDSAKVVMAISQADAAWWTGESTNKGKPYTGMGADALPFIERVSNSSAFRQVLEKRKLLNPPSGERRSTSDVDAMFS